MVWEGLEWLLPLELQQGAKLGAAQRAQGGGSRHQPQTEGTGSVLWGERQQVFELKQQFQFLPKIPERASAHCI